MENETMENVATIVEHPSAIVSLRGRKVTHSEAVEAARTFDKVMRPNGYGIALWGGGLTKDETKDVDLFVIPLTNRLGLENRKPFLQVVNELFHSCLDIESCGFKTEHYSVCVSHFHTPSTGTLRVDFFIPHGC